MHQFLTLTLLGIPLSRVFATVADALADDALVHHTVLQLHKETVDARATVG